VFTLIVRETKRVAAPTHERITGPVLPLFTSEALADEACRIEPGLDPKRIDDRDVLLRLLTDARAEGCRVVAVDVDEGKGLLVATWAAIQDLKGAQ
jgi:hypothetical protein